MSISYDPATGEPIETPEESKTEEVKDAAEEVKEAAEDAAEAVKETAEDAADAAKETAENAAENVQAAAENVAEEVKETAQEAVATVQDAVGGDPSEAKSGGFDPKYIIFGVLGVAIIAAIIFVLSTFVFSKRVKVEKAIAKTMDIDSQLYKDGRNLYKILTGKSYTVNGSLDTDEYGSASATFSVDGKDKQVAVKAEIEDMPEFTVLAGIDDKSIKAEIPEFADYLFVYNYNEDNDDGYLAEMIGDDGVESLNSACKVIYNYSAGSDEYTAKVAKLTREYEKKLKWEKAEAETFKVNDKKVKCKGYKTTIEKDLALDYWEDFTDLYLEEFADLNKELKKMGGEDLESAFKEVKSEIKSMKDMDITFYIYKGALAAVDFDAGKNDQMTILFKGGDYRAQNIVVESDDEEILELKGSKSKEKETYSLSAGGEDLFDLTYNTKKGVLTVEYEDYWDSYEYDFNISSSAGKFTLSAEDMDIEGEEVTLTLEINDSGKIEKYTNKDEFNIGTADEDDFEDLIDSIDMDELGDLAYMF